MNKLTLNILGLVLISNGVFPAVLSGSNAGKSPALQSNVFLPLCINYSPPPVDEMVFVPAGEFTMGCDSAHNGGYECTYTFELPLHKVYLDDYTIDKYEVTIAQYTECAVAGACAYPPLNDLSITQSPYDNNPIYHPMTNVSWYDANEYCTWAGKRLPTEAEWEKAARGTNVQAYPWGDGSPDCNLANYNWCAGWTTQVGSYPFGASPFGVLDMAGNAAEWVNDWIQADYYSFSPYENPTGPLTGTSKVMRGSYWHGDAWSLRVAFRTGMPRDYRATGLGFRCALSP